MWDGISEEDSEVIEKMREREMNSEYSQTDLR